MDSYEASKNIKTQLEDDSYMVQGRKYLLFMISSILNLNRRVYIVMI